MKETLLLKQNVEFSLLWGKWCVPHLGLWEGTRSTCCCCQSLVGNTRLFYTLPCPCLAISLRQQALHMRERNGLSLDCRTHKQTGHADGHHSRDPIACWTALESRQLYCNKTTRRCEVRELLFGLTYITTYTYLCYFKPVQIVEFDLPQNIKWWNTSRIM